MCWVVAPCAPKICFRSMDCDLLDHGERSEKDAYVSSRSLSFRLCIDLLYRLRPTRLPRLKCEKNRIVWFTKLTVLFYLEFGWVGGVCWVVAPCAICLKNKRANRI